MTRSSLGLLFALLVAGCASPGGGKFDLAGMGGDGGPQTLCQAGNTRSCFCLAGGQGTQVCRDDGMSFGSCTGCLNDGGNLSVSDMPAGNPCGDCDGCCNGSTCVPFANQSNSQCGAAGTVCGQCTSGTVCDGTGGTCVQSSGGSCGACANGCCGTAADGSQTCLINNAGQCGTGGGSCTACTQGTLCSNGSCDNKLDPMGRFRVTVSKTQFYNTDGMGNCWDGIIGCGQPNPQVCFGFDPGNGVVFGCTTHDVTVGVDNGKDPSDNAATDTATWDATTGLLKDTNGQPLYIPNSYFINGKVLVKVEDYDSTNSNDLIGSEYVRATDYFPSGYVLDKQFGRVLNVYFTLK